MGLFDVFEAFTGKAQKKALAAGKAASDQWSQRAYDESNVADQSGYDAATATLAPWLEQGQEAQAFYNDLLGLNGDEARDQRQAVISSDPMWQGKFAQDSNEMLRYGNARGWGPGKQALAGQRVLTANYGDWIDRYKEQGAQGGKFANDMATVQEGYGARKADRAYGYGMTRAGSETNYANAKAEAEGIGINNLFKLGGLAVKAYAASDRRLKTDIDHEGTLPSGLPFYSFRFINEPPGARSIGVMADEAREIFPDAVVTLPSGYLAVDYSKIR